MAAWLAIFAMLCQALMPTIAQASASHSPSVLVLQLCSASGARHIVIDEGTSKPSPVKSFLAAHCPYCAGTPHFALPPVVSQPPLAARFVNRVYTPLVAAPSLKSRKLSTAAPRGPPVLS
ncbi:DUF2946 domain-containing protein [Paraburkholderia phenazinium]|uniref:DUF2946 family protein n=2 Tax=Paraburkholderia phenazinium TaxID=60549 RepID=A0A1G7TS32_9BURK|nr:DUF2946 domain-containing protein [Paraburkholderia phenazinium]SDG38126.1 Protein of unknown function [Paraburkholderia phenazinium]